jgi:hypothetical protein
MDTPYKPCSRCGAKEGKPEDGGPLMAARHDITGLWTIDCLNCGKEGPTALSMTQAAKSWNDLWDALPRGAESRTNAG